MKQTTILLLIYIVTAGCSNNNNKTNIAANKTKLVQIDSLYGLKIGDTFLHDSLETYGFILIKIEHENLNFLPVKLENTKSGVEKILNGKIRFVPASLTNPDNGKIGIECLAIMGNVDIKDFKGKFKLIRNLTIRKPYPDVSSSSYVALTSIGLNSFADTYEYSWDGRAKMVDTKEIIE